MAVVRNYLYGAGVLVINHSATYRVQLRVIGYEIPIYSRGKSRDECIDLLAYDASLSPWVIELKKSDSHEQICDVVDQLKRYTEAFERGIRENIQSEIRERYLWPKFKFSGKAKGMILADRAFFKNQKQPHQSRNGVLFCSFARFATE
jgi:hypothetical protein